MRMMRSTTAKRKSRLKRMAPAAIRIACRVVTGVDYSLVRFWRQRFVLVHMISDTLSRSDLTPLIPLSHGERGRKKKERLCLS